MAKVKGELIGSYGGFVRIPYSWFKLCKKYSVEDKNGNTKNITINLNEVTLLAIIAGWNDQLEECFETNAKIAEQLNVSIDAVKKYTRELRQVGLLKTYEEKDNPVHTSKRTLYVQYGKLNEIVGINVPSEHTEAGTNVNHGVDECTQSGVQTYPVEVDKCKPNNNIYKNNKNIYNTNEDEENCSKEIKIFAEHQVTKSKLGKYNTVSLNNIEYNEHMNSLIFGMSYDTTLKELIDGAKTNGLSKDYACSYIAEYINGEIK